MIPTGLIGPYIGTNVAALLLFAAAIWRPILAHRAIIVLFVAAAITNVVAVIGDQEIYVEGYGPVAMLGAYRAFIYGPFARHTQAWVLAIASGQVIIGALLLLPNRLSRHIGLAGGIIFLIAIAPLGAGSAFPATLVMAAALLVTGMRYTAPSDSRPSVPQVASETRDRRIAPRNVSRSSDGEHTPG